MISAVSVSALPLSGVLSSTALLIWAAFGLVGMIGGLVTVRVARHRSQPATAATESPAPTKERLDTAAQPAASQDTVPAAQVTPDAAEDQTQASRERSDLLLTP